MSKPDLPLIIEVEDFVKLPPRDDILLIAVCQPAVFQRHHLPAAQLVQPAQLVATVGPATGKLPQLDQLLALFSRLGLSEDKQVVVYDDEGGGWAGRLIWTLDVLGHHRSSYLNGGLVAWLEAGYPVESGAGDAPEKVDEMTSPAYRATIDSHYIASLDEVRSSLGDPGTVIWDARASEEFQGLKQTARRNGHIPGAVNLDWLDTMDREHGLRLLPTPRLKQMLADRGIVPGKKVITHCHTHHRSGLSYLIAKELGMDVKAYDGSWSEWGNLPDTPIETP